MSPRQIIQHRADHVGSLLRPAAIKRARDAWKAGALDAEGLRAIEDKEIAQLVKQQLAHGVQSISDGELRREWFHLDFIQHLGGVEVLGVHTTAKGASDIAAPPSIAVTGSLRHVHPIEVDNFRFLQAQLAQAGGATAEGAPAVVKVAIPSPTMVHFRGGRAAVDIAAYPSMDAFFDDLAACWRAEIRALGEAGCTFLQLDDTNLAYLCDPTMRAAAAGRGDDPHTLPRQYAQLINSALRDRPEGMTVGIHLCRGNFRSRHFAAGGYEPIAEVLFRELDVDVYFLEFDTERAGTFEPLRFLPHGHKTVVLGLVSSKVPALEDVDALVARVHEAAKFAPLEQLAVSPQCGFSSTAHGNEITEADQWAKLDLVNKVAKAVWGQ